VKFKVGDAPLHAGDGERESASQGHSTPLHFAKPAFNALVIFQGTLLIPGENLLSIFKRF